VRIFHLCADQGVPLDGTKGASVHLRDLATAFARQGHDVRMFVANLGSGPSDGLPFGVQELETDSIRDAAATYGRPDAVYERYALGHDEGLGAARDLDLPFVLEVNAPLVAEASRHRPWKVGPGDREVERKLFREADLVVAVSEPLRSYVAEVRGTSRGTTVVRNGCDPERFAAVRPPARDGEAATLVFLGHPKPWHGAEELPRLVAELRRRGHDVRLLLIGGGQRANRVLDRARAKGVLDHVEVTDELSPEEAARRLSEGTVAVAPYPPHPFFYFCPLKVMECMAAGLPVVSTAQGDVPLILGDAGVAVPPGDRTALADAVETLLSDDDLRRSLGDRARARAMSTFTWDHAADDVIESIRQVSVRGHAA
jgi:glycosyltransferase involved in cell wall biosynthesis